MTQSVLDFRGLKCPLPVIRSRKAFLKMSDGDTVRIECTDPLAEIDIPHMTKSDGHTIVDRGVSGDVLWFVIEVRK